MNNPKFLCGTAEDAQKKLNSARYNLLLMIILTLVNLILFFAGRDAMLLFSATIPYVAVVFGDWIAPSGMAIAIFILAGLLIAVYFLCWLLSKKDPAWMIVALVLFVIDTAVMVYLKVALGDFSGILDLLIHIWVLYYLVIGVIGGVKLKKLPPVEQEQNPEWPNVEQ